MSTRVAPSPSRRSTSASRSSGRKSKCSRFLTSFDSGTRMKRIPGSRSALARISYSSSSPAGSSLAGPSPASTQPSASRHQSASARGSRASTTVCSHSRLMPAIVERRLVGGSRRRPASPVMTEQQVMIVTGATNGIGEAAAIELARRGAHVGIVARNPRKADVTVDRIRAAASGASVDVFLGDLSLMGDVRKVAAEMLDRYEHIDVLVNNAGIQLQEQRTTAEGLPEMIAVNYLAPWLLTSLLRDRLVASAPARVVVTASEAHRLGWTVDPDTILTDTSAFGAASAMSQYGKSKLLDVLFTFELADRLADTGVTANCCCPGLVATGLAGTENLTDRVATSLSRTPLVRRPEQGARVLVQLATEPDFGTRTGQFISSTPGAGLLPPIPAT